MKFLVLLGIGLILIVRGVYVTVSINGGSDKFKGQGLAARVLIYIGVACIAIVPAWYLFFTEPTEKAAEKPQALNWSLVSTKSENIDADVLKRAIVIFQNNCEGLQKYYNAVEKLEAQVVTYSKGANPSYTEERYGWLTELVLTISIKNDAKLPSDLRMLPGVTLYYYLGAGHTPGIVMMKAESALFYGIAENKIVKGQNTFVQDDAYSIVDSIPVSQ